VSAMIAMKDFAFKVDLVAVVRVRAGHESVARKVVPAVVAAPGNLEICCDGPRRTGNPAHFKWAAVEMRRHPRQNSMDCQTQFVLASRFGLSGPRNFTV
jgi:hypothetical protein